MNPELVAWESMAYLKARAGGHGGIILLDPRGRIGLAHNTPRMAFAYRTGTEESSGMRLEQAAL